MPVSTIEETLANLVERVESRCFGKYRGVVVDNDDPEKMGRITARVPEVLVETVTPWAMPAAAFAGDGHGLTLVPEPGDGVWIEFEAGDLSRPIWSGGWWARGEQPAADPVTTRLLRTSAGHEIEIDERADTVRLVHPGGAEVVLASDGITLSMGASEIAVKSTEVNINRGMVKVSAAGVSLANDAMKVV